MNRRTLLQSLAVVPAVVQEFCDTRRSLLKNETDASLEQVSHDGFARTALWWEL
jgi:hypothetical protein